MAVLPQLPSCWDYGVCQHAPLWLQNLPGDMFLFTLASRISVKNVSSFKLSVQRVVFFEHFWYLSSRQLEEGASGWVFV